MRRPFLSLFTLLAFAPLSATAGVGPVAEVVAVQPARAADLVLLERGFDAGLRQGMVCRVTRGAIEIAEVLLVEIRAGCSAALILSVAPRQSIRSGDHVHPKILKS